MALSILQELQKIGHDSFLCFKRLDRKFYYRIGILQNYYIFSPNERNLCSCFYEFLITSSDDETSCLQEQMRYVEATGWWRECHILRYKIALLKMGMIWPIRQGLWDSVMSERSQLAPNHRSKFAMDTLHAGQS